ncbi:hypothetical protein [Aquidulcibacter sp.]|uniref:TolB family protein n=1 Tax=Aquidulcibacter sp. TaxID=2052990 RepID=UPI0025BF0641|nr:hypothetical protein [Aquidulcibacter sp.]MCA3697487.1 PD40 domain-containing protein [Aquidulcibacter sp.]
MTPHRRELIGLAALGSVGLPLLSACAGGVDRIQAGGPTEAKVSLDDWVTRALCCSLTRDGGFGMFPRLDTREMNIALVDFKNSTSVSYMLDQQFLKIEHAVMSPDGSRIAFNVQFTIPGFEPKYFAVDRPEFGNVAEIWVMNRKGEVEFRLVDHDREKRAATFSPDGTKLLFYADMRHQYLKIRYPRSHNPSVAVHEFDLNDRTIRLIDLPILPRPDGCFYTEAKTVVGVWRQEVVDAEFSRLPVDCPYPWGMSNTNYWRRFLPFYSQTIGEADLISDGTSVFKKFETKLPRFESIRDKFQMQTSPCEDGFLVLLELMDPRIDPAPIVLENPNYFAFDRRNYKLAWLSRDGTLNEIHAPERFTSYPSVCGSFDRSRVLAWAGTEKLGAAQFTYPFTSSNGSNWELVDLTGNFGPASVVQVSGYTEAVTVQIPKLLDPNGVGVDAES